MACMMTTAPGFDGYRITAYHGIVTAEAAMTTSLKDNSRKWESVRQFVYDELAGRLPPGANALVGIQVSHNQFQGAGLSAQFYFFATGTAVTIEKE